MPSKRSKSKEREKQRKRRQNLTEEMKETVREKDRVRKKIAKSNLPEEEFEVQKSKISDEDKEFNKIKKKHRMREMRNSRSGKDHLTENLQAKKGMALLESEGRKKILQGELGVNSVRWMILKDIISQEKGLRTNCWGKGLILSCC